MGSGDFTLMEVRLMGQTMYHCLDNPSHIR